MKKILAAMLILCGVCYGADNVTLSYAAGSDTLTIDNNTAATPITWQMIYADGGWATAGLINTDHMTEVVAGKVYVIKDNIIFGADNSKATIFSSTNEMVYFEDDKKFTTYADANDPLTITFGNVTSDGYGYNGSSWSICPTGSLFWGYENSSGDAGAANTQIIMYASSIINRSAAFEYNIKFFSTKTNGVILKDCVFGNTATAANNTYKWYIDSTTASVSRCKFYNVSAVDFAKVPVLFADNEIYRSFYGVRTELSATVDNLTIYDNGATNSYPYKTTGAFTLTLNNPKVAVVAADIENDNSSSVVVVNYTSNIKALDENDVPLASASVQHYYKTGTGNWTYIGTYTTNSSGFTGVKNFTYQTFTGTSETMAQTYHRLIVSKTGTTPFTIDNLTVSTQGVITLKNQPWLNVFKKTTGKINRGTVYKKLQ